MRMPAANFNFGEEYPRDLPPLSLKAVSDTGDAPRPSRTTWVLAALGAVLIHAGCVALAVDYLQPDDDGQELGATAIAIGVELAAPQRDPSELPPGPEADASTASPEIAEQKTVVEDTELPKATPTETDDPDRVVAPEATKKPADEAPETPTVQTAPSTLSMASEAAAMPSPQTAQQSPRSTAPELGTGESLRRVRRTWQKELSAHLDKYKRYPGDRSHKSAEIVIRFVLDRAGHVVSADIDKTSGDAAFDNAALAMMRRADPVPAPPPLVADETLTFSLPVIFRVKGRS
jgi:periplasmic protein TonB